MIADDSLVAMYDFEYTNSVNHETECISEGAIMYGFWECDAPHLAAPNYCSNRSGTSRPEAMATVRFILQGYCNPGCSQLTTFDGCTDNMITSLVTVNQTDLSSAPSFYYDSRKNRPIYNLANAANYAYSNYGNQFAKVSTDEIQVFVAV